MRAAAIGALPCALALTAPTPCTRVCRYSSAFYDGRVCIGCFREEYEIEWWASMSASERGYALRDAADRRPDGDSFEGGASREDLLRDAEAWEALAAAGSGDDRQPPLGTVAIGGSSSIDSVMKATR